MWALFKIFFYTNKARKHLFSSEERPHRWFWLTLLAYQTTSQISCRKKNLKRDQVPIGEVKAAVWRHQGTDSRYTAGSTLAALLAVFPSCGTETADTRRTPSWRAHSTTSEGSRPVCSPLLRRDAAAALSALAAKFLPPAEGT